MRALVAVGLLVLAPLAAAASEPWVGELRDRADDVVTRERRPFAFPSSDILNFTSRRLEDGRVEQRVEMAEAPGLASNSIIVRSWFRNTTGATFYTLDLEVHGDAEKVETFQAYARRDAFDNRSAVEATWRIEGASWVFGFDPSTFAPDAECFLPMVYAYVSGPEGSGAFDSIGMTGDPCETLPEPQPGKPVDPNVPIVVRSPGGALDESAPTIEPPGSRTPSPGLSTALSVAAVLVVALLARRR